MGSLPAHVELIGNYEPLRGTFCQAFHRDTRTRSISYADSRFKRLAIDHTAYEKGCEEDREGSLPIEAKTLRKAGVMIETIKLI